MENNKKKNRITQRGGKPRAAFAKVLALILLIALILMAGAGVHSYAKFSRLMEAKLQLRPPQKTAVYSAPYRVWTGQELSWETLAARLDRIGYSRLSAASGQAPPVKPGDWYVVEQEKVGKTTVHFEHRKLGNREAYEIVFAGSRVASIRKDRREVQEGLLKPEFVSNLYGPSREKKKYVHFEELPQDLVHAVLAAEDERFFSHPGLDVIALMRASFVNLWNRSRLQGGSTLTQQFIKNYFLTPEKSVKRKLEEIYMALLLERRLSKERIFELYANEVYLGQVGSFAVLGFGQGADTYFGKSVKDLSLAESALLAGIIQAPNRYSPHRNRNAALQRRNYVLELMEEKGFLSTRENAAAKTAPLEVLPAVRHNYAEAPYFVDWVKDTLDRDLPGWDQELHDLNLYTTLVPDLQQAAFDAVRQGIEEVDRLLSRRKKSVEPQVALLAIHPRTAEVLAMIGGRNYGLTQYNRAVDALRQPGSTFKPFVYAAALEKSLAETDSYPYTLSSVFVDEPYTFHFEEQEYSPRNSDEKYYGLVSLRRALALSLNVATVKLAEEVGFHEVVSVSQRAGIRQGLKPYPSVALGTFDVTLLELAQAYMAFANNGEIVPLRAITALERNGRPQEFAPKARRHVLQPEIAFLMTSALESVLNEGTGAGVRARGFRQPAAGKTGTSNDSWFVGYTPELLCAVWVGLDDSKPLHLSGAQAALPIWTHFMLKAQRLGYLSGRNFPVPESIVTAQIDSQTGLLASPYCKETRTEYYVRGTEPVLTCSGTEDEFVVARKAGAETPPANRESLWKRVWKIFTP